MSPAPARQFIVKVFDAADRQVVEREVSDFRALADDVAFSAVAEGRLLNDGRWGSAAIEPSWADGKLSGITVSRAGCDKFFGTHVFADYAWSALASARLLAEDEDPKQVRHYTWCLTVQDSAGLAARRRLAASLTHAPFPLSSRSLADFGIPADGGDRPIWVSSPLLEELRTAAADHLDRERADFLTGHLILAGTRPLAVLTGRIEAAAATGSSATHFGFSPQSFTAARQELERRHNGETILAWSHNHPPSCGRDCLMKVPACETDNLFFSLQDRTVHRSGFTAPFMCALVAGKAAGRRADDAEVRAYGWQDGAIVEKEFGIFQGSL